MLVTTPSVAGGQRRLPKTILERKMEDTGGEDGEDDDADEGTEEEVEVEDHDQEFCGVAGARPAKMRKLTWRACLCCTVRVVPRGEPLKKFAEKSWATLHKAAEVRLNATYFFLNDQGTSLGEGSLSEPKGLYHKQCDSSYTSKRNLDIIVKKGWIVQDQRALKT